MFKPLWMIYPQSPKSNDNDLERAYRPNAISIHLIVEELIAILEKLYPRVDILVLGRSPVIVVRKVTNNVTFSVGDC